MSARPYAKFLMLAFGLCALSLMPGGHKAQASAPAGRYAYPDGSVSSSGTVYDTFTHLTWQRVPSGQGTDGGTTAYTWANATTYCQTTLSAAMLGGYSDWRLPGVKEFASIVDFTTASSSTIDSAAFPGTELTWFWTAQCAGATACSASSGLVYNVPFFSDSWVAGNDVPTHAYAVRCVRGP